ncbi:MAG: ABC transporter substrate-binding protein [Chloroflexi bacterium]|nr:ABC transporter substrate-binding protein [Chloroflexota bacterium]
MVRLDVRVLRTLALSLVAMLVLAACGPGTTSSPGGSGAGSPGASAGGSAAAGQTGGTIYLLTQADEFNRVDPQRAYTGEDLAFFGATIYRALVAYTVSSDDKAASVLVPDLATDTGTANADATSWEFTLRDGVTWQDGSDITCEDVKYGVSRTFANDVISEGPTYAIQYLDVPANPITDENDPKSVFLSAYYGPYDGTGQELFDKAVVCDGKTITFNLSGPHPDFNYTTTLGFSPVPKAADTGETYGIAKPPMSSGPYKVDSYTTGNGGKMILSRNEAWDQASDDYRTPYPDGWEVDFGLDPAVIDERLIASAGNDVTAIGRDGLQPQNLPTVFTDPKTPQAKFEGRAISGYDIYALYYWINVQKVPNVKHRQAMAVALDRDAIRKNGGGNFLGDFADGVIKPNIGPDYAESGMWTDMFGAAVPDTGDPELAKQLIADSGEPAPKLSFNFADTPTGNKNAAIVISSFAKAGITVTPAPLESGKYYSIVFDPEKAGDFGVGGWGADWPNASTVIPPLFTQIGGWDLSQVDDEALNAKIDAAVAETDRTAQNALWQALNKEAMENVYVIPTFFELTQFLGGTKINSDGLFLWGPYGSLSYGVLSVVK